MSMKTLLANVPKCIATFMVNNYCLLTITTTTTTTTTVLMAWDTPTRVRYKTKVQDGYSEHQAARLLGVPNSTARGWLQKGDRVQKPPGRPAKLPDSTVLAIIQWFTGHYDRRILSPKQIKKEFNLNVSRNTILKALAHFGYYYHVPDYVSDYLEQEVNGKGLIAFNLPFILAISLLWHELLLGTTTNQSFILFHMKEKAKDSHSRSMQSKSFKGH
ncbi:hypothetical protein B7463_g3297, partial [Scytalidium lignicola]